MISLYYLKFLKSELQSRANLGKPWSMKTFLKIKQDRGGVKINIKVLILLTHMD